MRFKYLTTALWFSAAAVAAPLSGALAADSFGTQLFAKSQLGPQAVEGSALTSGTDVRLTVTATEAVTVSVVWLSSSGESKALLSDTKLAKGQSISVPSASGWIPVEAGQGVQSFQVFATDAAGNVEQEQVAALVVEKDVAVLDQKTFSALSKAGSGAEPVKGFSSFSSKNMKTRQTAPTFASAPGLPKQPQAPAPATPAPAQTPAPAETPAPQASKEPQYFELDINGDGKTDAYGADTSGDGYYDIILVDENGDGVLDYVMLDLNYNGTIDAMVIPTTDKGKTYDIWVFDENEDGTPDYYGFDWNQDGTIDDWQKA